MARSNIATVWAPISSPSLVLALRIARLLELPIEALFALDPLIPLDPLNALNPLNPLDHAEPAPSGPS